MVKRGKLKIVLQFLNIENFSNFLSHSPQEVWRRRGKLGMGKKGAWELEELGKIALAIFFLVALILIAVFLFKGGGGAVLDKIKTMLRFGG